MTTIVSYEAEFSAKGVQEVTDGFEQIARAAALAKRDQQVANQNMRDEAAKTIKTEKQLAAESAKASAQTQAMYKQIGAAALIAGAAITKFGVDSYKTYQDYSGQVRDLAKISGTGAVETSRLIQVLDDYQISAEQVTAATRFMTKQGLAPTIETLARLSDQYNSLTTVQEKNAFVLKNLGRGGMQWINVLNQGGDAILANAEDVNKWLVMTDEQIKNSEKSRLAIDEVTDAWEGAKVQVGSWIGEMIIANKVQKENNDRWDDYAEMLGMTGPELEKAGASYSAFTAQMQRGAAATDYYQNMVAQMTGKQEENIEITDEQLQLSFAITAQNKKYAESMKDINAAIDEQQAKVDMLAKIGYSPMGKTLGEQIAKLNELKETAQNVSQSQVDAAEATVSSLLAQAEATNQTQLDFALATGQITQEAYDQAVGLQQITDALNSQKISAEEAAVAVQLLIGRLKALDGMTVTAYIDVIGAGYDPIVNKVNKENKAAGKTTAEIKHAGGQLSHGWTLVGDAPGGKLTPYSELISPSGYVYNAEQTRQLMKSGKIKPVSRAFGDIDTTTTTGTIRPSTLPPLPTGITGKVNPGTGNVVDMQTTQSVQNIINSIVPEIQMATAQAIIQTLPSFQQSVIGSVMSANQNMQVQQSIIQSGLLQELNDNILTLISKTASAGDIGRSVQYAVQTGV